MEKVPKPNKNEGTAKQNPKWPKTTNKRKHRADVEREGARERKKENSLESPNILGGGAAKMAINNKN